MPTIFDADAHSTGPIPPRARSRASAAFHDLPDIYEPRRRRLPPMVLTGAMFLVVSTVFFGAESLLPPDYKPSHFIGGYQGAIAQARAQGELKARIAYDGRLKLIETDAIRYQEQCRAGLHNVNNLYQAAYARAGLYAQSTANMQQQYVASRVGLAQQTVGGEVAVANIGTLFAYGISLFDPETGQRSMEFAEQARQQALRKLDEAASSGVTLSVEGWNTNLPDPATLPLARTCELPASLVAPPPSSEG